VVIGPVKRDPFPLQRVQGVGTHRILRNEPGVKTGHPKETPETSPVGGAGINLDGSDLIRQDADALGKQHIPQILKLPGRYDKLVGIYGESCLP